MSAETGSSPGPGRPRSELAHRAILDATLERLSEVGYDRLTVGSVASLAGVAKATIYRRWASKLPLVIEAFSQLPTLASPDTGNVVDDLEAILRSFAEILTTTPLASVLPILAGECAHDPLLSELLAPHIKARREPLIRVLERAVSRCELPPDIDLEAAADVIMGPIVKPSSRPPSSASTASAADLAVCATDEVVVPRAARFRGLESSYSIPRLLRSSLDFQRSQTIVVFPLGSRSSSGLRLSMWPIRPL
jgi:AcrR family transcriptional regulator